MDLQGTTESLWLSLVYLRGIVCYLTSRGRSRCYAGANFKCFISTGGELSSPPLPSTNPNVHVLFMCTYGKRKSWNPQNKSIILTRSFVTLKWMTQVSGHISGRNIDIVFQLLHMSHSFKISSCRLNCPSVSFTKPQPKHMWLVLHQIPLPDSKSYMENGTLS